MQNAKCKIARWPASLIVILATVITISAGLGFCEAWADVRTCIKIKGEAWIKGEKVYLKDIASIEGPTRLKERLGAIYLGYSPQPGRYKTIRGTWIESKIRSKRWLPVNTALHVPESVRVNRTWQSIQEKDLQELYNNYIAKQLKGREANFRVSRFKVVGNGQFPEGKMSIELVRQGDGRLLGYVSLTAIVRVDGKIEQRMVLSGWVDRFEDVVCTSRSLRRNSIITEEDLCMKQRNISRLPFNVLTSMEAVVGKRLKQSLKTDTALLANMVEDPPLIKRGDKVIIMGESPTLLVTTLGIAQAKGGIGDQIRVKNCMSQKQIIARIINASTVRVEF
ncbi:MAG: flagellar basal body P-ring formation protein FlgA [Deltaproteobacteria bacterium]|nr:flagellar basal body P-ring formation protein FlgA [Deltaproteobacteria bacterium]MBW2019131.1 flagellar basal body P-ring formation protein FlgA [Deltaproteobacteria bacterium]MBW2073198.1 flagellar basal body P-ring formation protein FlgA [Deltaproteobacteria bacterium]